CFEAIGFLKTIDHILLSLCRKQNVSGTDRIRDDLAIDNLAHRHIATDGIRPDQRPHRFGKCGICYDSGYIFPKLKSALEHTFMGLDEGCIVMASSKILFQITYCGEYFCCVTSGRCYAEQ